MKWPTPVAASPLPLKGAEARGSKPTCVGLDGARDGRVSRPCGLQGALADRQSRIRGGRWAGLRLRVNVFGGGSSPGGASGLQNRVGLLCGPR